MSQESPAVLARLLQSNGLGWLIDMHAHPDQAKQVIPALLEKLKQVEVKYLELIKVAVSFSPESLEIEAARNPHKVQALLQALRASRSPEMLVMVWRIHQGLSIREVVLNYRERDLFRLTVILARPGDGQDQLEEYQSEDIFDATLVRHFGVGTVNDKPMFDGFYPLRLAP